MPIFSHPIKNNVIESVLEKNLLEIISELEIGIFWKKIRSMSKTSVFPISDSFVFPKLALQNQQIGNPNHNWKYKSFGHSFVSYCFLKYGKYFPCFFLRIPFHSVDYPSDT